MTELSKCKDELSKCKDELLKSLKRRGLLLKENNELKNVNNELMKLEREVKGELSDTTQLLDRTSSVGSNLSYRTSSVGSNLSYRTERDEKEHIVNLEVEVEISLKKSPDYKVNIMLRVTNKDKINDIKQNILDKLSLKNLKNLKSEQIIIINNHSGEVIERDNLGLFDLFKNGNISIAVIDREKKGGSKKKKYKRKKSKRIKRKSKTRRRRR